MAHERDEHEELETGRGRVLVVEDEPELRRLVRRSLVRFGHEVAEALNGRDALRLMRERDFDVVVSDVRMPDIGGLDLVEQLSAEHPDVSVVLVSGAPDLVTARRAKEYGVVDYLMKPVSSSLLRSVVWRGVVRHRERLREQQAGEVRESGERLRAAVPVSEAAAPVKRSVG